MWSSVHPFLNYIRKEKVGTFDSRLFRQKEVTTSDVFVTGYRKETRDSFRSRFDVWIGSVRRSKHFGDVRKLNLKKGSVLVSPVVFGPTVSCQGRSIFRRRHPSYGDYSKGMCLVKRVGWSSGTHDTLLVLGRPPFHFYYQC